MNSLKTSQRHLSYIIFFMNDLFKLYELCEKYMINWKWYINIERSRDFHREFEWKITTWISSIEVTLFFLNNFNRLTYQNFSKTCEIEKDHLVDKTTQQAEQIRKSIRNLHTLRSIILKARTHLNHELHMLCCIWYDVIYDKMHFKWPKYGFRIAQSYFSSKHKKCAQDGFECSIQILMVIFENLQSKLKH